MQIRTLSVLFALFALLVLAADARPWRGMRDVMKKRLNAEERDLTNAERLARGLPPRAPGLKRVMGARAAVSPSPSTTTPTSTAHPSPSPSSGGSVFSGRIAVTKDDKLVGFLNNTASGLGSVDLDGAAGTDIEVKFAFTSAKSPVSVEVTNPLFSGPAFLGGASNTTLASDSAAAVKISDVPQTRSGARPTANGASGIWLYHRRSQEFTAQWRNTDGTSVNATIAFDAAANFVFLTGDLAAYNAAANATAEAVEFVLTK
ncbi:hypothetical protein EIP86_005376 [Pleurotus ostreatoroseus]|nr:hypothetical protein EIP86_005376 [Pleurotus ostreatoroseus]